MSHNLKSNTVWHPLFSNLWCIQVLLTETPSVLDLYTFDIISPRGGRISKDYKILPEDCINRSQLREGDVKTITLIDEHANQLSHSIFAYVEYLGCSARNGWKGRISVPKDKPLNLCNIECYGNHNSKHVQKKTLRMSNSVRKTIANRVANVTPSMLATA
ncbi:9327_t:CDS:2 [Dentiscutata erythropus]|uniref:9327_t:CDS:1 n=1 Tax=Dentiscutata erythropus TaxID=1348616 RepID=A0A9N9ANV9_9GLOM|nr:9327_t:CDS:2 [Dentiscutata erythropus]